MDESGAAKTEKPKKPPPKRNRKTAAQLKAEAAAKAEQQQSQQQQQVNIQKEFQIPVSSQRPNGDFDANMMPPPKVAEAPSVVAASAKAMHNAVTSQQSNASPQKLDQKPPLQQM
jgi:hypothetical protein